MVYDWDPSKDAANVAKHGIEFAAVSEFEWATALVRADVRFGYSEPRLIAYGRIGIELYMMVYTVERRSRRVISLRRASQKEVRLYASEG